MKPISRIVNVQAYLSITNHQPQLTGTNHLAINDQWLDHHSPSANHQSIPTINNHELTIIHHTIHLIQATTSQIIAAKIANKEAPIDKLTNHQFSSMTNNSPSHNHQRFPTTVNLTIHLPCLEPSGTTMIPDFWQFASLWWHVKAQVAHCSRLASEGSRVIRHKGATLGLCTGND